MSLLFERNIKGYADIAVDTLYSLMTTIIANTTVITSTFSFLPALDNVLNLGSATFRWANLYVGTLYATTVFRTVPMGWGRLLAAQSIPTATDTVILLNSYVASSGITYSSVTGQHLNATTLPLNIMVQAVLKLNANPTNAWAWFELSGDTNLYGRSNFAVTSGATRGIVSIVSSFTLAPGQYFTLKVYQDSGSAANVWGAGSGVGENSGTLLTYALI